MEELERDFKGVWIPKEVWLDTRLNALEKVILVEINSLDKDKGCYASNEYLAEFCQCSVWKASEAIAKLKKLDYVYIKSFDGRNRFLGSRLGKNQRQTWEKPKADLGISQATNIDNNIKNNIKENSIKEKPNKTKLVKDNPPTLQEIKDYIKSMGYEQVVNAESFFYTYRDNGWIKTNGSPIISWKGTIGTWVGRAISKNPELANTINKEENVAKKEEKKRLAKNVEKQIEEQIKKQQEELLKS